MKIEDIEAMKDLPEDEQGTAVAKLMLEMLLERQRMENMVKELRANGKPVNLGEARIDCSFAIREVLIKQPQVSQRVAEKLVEFGHVDHIEPGEGRVVERACGSYVLGTSFEVLKTTISEIYQYILEARDELKLKKIKVMIGGPLVHVFPPGSGLFDAKFTRGVTEIETTGFNFGELFESEHDGVNRVIRIHKYQQVKRQNYCDRDYEETSDGATADE